MDCEAYEVDLFKELYYLRWGIEENYKRLKQWVEIENGLANFPVAYCGLKIITSLRSVSLIFSECDLRSQFH
jgi:IS4 transposase